ncbi:VOC family protein [bacterium]|nr:MAG: VOC family protein [bacterium]
MTETTPATITVTTLTPHIACRNAEEAIEFYQKAFGAQLLMKMNIPGDGRVIHADLSIDGARFYVVDEFPEQGGKSPQALGGSPVMLSLQVEDCDAVFAKAIEAGCTVQMPLADMFWGDRWGLLVDPYGHSWSISTPKQRLTAEEIREQMSTIDMSAGCGSPA